MEIIERDGGYHISPRPQTAKDWLAAITVAWRWTLTSARLPLDSARRRYARVTAALAAVTVAGVGAAVAAVVYLALR